MEVGGMHYQDHVYPMEWHLKHQDDLWFMIQFILVFEIGSLCGWVEILLSTWHF